MLFRSTEVEVGIDRVYGAIKRGEVIVFDDLPGTLEELQSYSRVVDEAGTVTEAIENKSDYHCLDAARYILSWVKRTAPVFTINLSGQRVAAAGAPRGVFLEGDRPW